MHNSQQPAAKSQKPTAKVLVTGGAGFIGSNLVEALLQLEAVSLVRVLDNLSTGHISNIEPFLAHPKFEFLQGDIRDFEVCTKACEGMTLVSHQAALGSVPRSINDPLTTNGDSPDLPKREDVTGKPLSPYAVTKLVTELYADVFSKLYDINFIGLRYFNIFGPKQDPNGAYAAVIPLFMKAILENKAPTINGDGQHSRDFTYVDNAVQANIKALFTQRTDALNQVYNIATGKSITLLELFDSLKQLAHSDLSPSFGPERPGDIKHSLADISKAINYLGYYPQVSVIEGLERAFRWYREKQLLGVGR
jgi:UDP-N-acetylglucosamine/UDP-N-acetylgalactosamine 4-epimerase